MIIKYSTKSELSICHNFNSSSLIHKIHKNNDKKIKSVINIHCRYDRTKLTLKEIHNTQYISCMNPTAGSFVIDPRLQRHFAVFAVR